MDYVQLLKDEIASGFSKSDLEFLIGLPKNSLSGVINQGRPLSKKSKAKIEAFLQSDKPDPTTFKRIKEVVKENNKPENRQRILAERNEVPKEIEVRKHPLTTEDAHEPAPGTMAWFLKYGDKT